MGVLGLGVLTPPMLPQALWKGRIQVTLDVCKGLKVFLQLQIAVPEGSPSPGYLDSSCSSSAASTTRETVGTMSV